MVQRSIGFIMLTTLALMGCAENDLSFFISKASMPGAGCIVSDDVTSSIGISRGLLDVSVKKGYLMFPQVENRLASTSSSAESVERNNLHMREFRITLDLGEIPGEFPQGLLEFSVLVSGMIEPGGSLKMGLEVLQEALASFLQPVIPKNYQPVITVTLVAVASRSSEEVESAEFVFPIELCNACLVDWSDENCTAPQEEGENKFISNLCGLPQDAPVTCCNTMRGLKCLMDEDE